MNKRQVSTGFGQILSSDIYQYQIDLSIASLENGPPGQMTSNERHDLLKRHQQAWLAVSPERNFHQIGTPVPVTRINACSGGILVHRARESSLNTSKIIFNQLSCQYRGIPSTNWTVELDFLPNCWDMDPSQDLWILGQPEGYMCVAFKMFHCIKFHHVRQATASTTCAFHVNWHSPPPCSQCIPLFASKLLCSTLSESLVYNKDMLRGCS